MPAVGALALLVSAMAGLGAAQQTCTDAAANSVFLRLAASCALAILSSIVFARRAARHERASALGLTGIWLGIASGSLSLLGTPGVLESIANSCV